MMPGEASVNDIVQITSDEHHWFPCLVVVNELKSYGVMGFVMIPSNDGTPAGQAYIFLKSGQYEIVGHAVIVPGGDR